MDTDSFFILIEKHLERHAESKKPKPYKFEDLVHDVVAEYIFRLMNQGHIPQRFLDHLERDLTEEAWDFLKKKTYGSMTLDGFKEQKTVRRRKSVKGT